MLEIVFTLIVWGIFIGIFFDDIIEILDKFLAKPTAPFLWVCSKVKALVLFLAGVIDHDDDDDLPPPSAVLTSYDMNVDNEPQYMSGLSWQN